MKFKHVFLYWVVCINNRIGFFTFFLFVKLNVLVEIIL